MDYLQFFYLMKTTSGSILNLFPSALTYSSTESMTFYAEKYYSCKAVAKISIC